MAKKTTKPRAANSARSARGRSFTKGNKYAWQPGQSGNPSGRPQDTITPHLRQIIRQKCPGLDEVTYGQLIAGALVNRAIAGNVRAIAEISDRLEGKPRQAIDFTETSLDWRERARREGLNIADVVEETRRMLEEYDRDCAAQSEDTPLIN